jgi:putative intracellular protease/amidase
VRRDRTALDLWTRLAVLAALGCGGGAGPRADGEADTATRERQAQAFIEALKPRRPGPPVIVILARNAGTETTDFLLTHGVLQRSGVAEVLAVAPQRGRVSLYPALSVDVTEDYASFERAHPAGADYVIVPAMSENDDPAITGWLKQQSQRGARIIGVCVGALVVAEAGLLDGRRFTTHWYYRESLQKKHPTARYVPNQRYVIDRDVATTTGITASVPAMLALIEAIGGREKARAVAHDLGVRSWTPAHDSSRFGLNAARRWNYVLTKLAFWRREDWNAEVRDGVDDIALAFAVDAWSRTGRVRVTPTAPGPVKLRSGLQLAVQRATEGAPHLPLMASLKPLQQLDRTLCEIEQRYGDADRDRVMMELEYSGPARACN